MPDHQRYNRVIEAAEIVKTGARTAVEAPDKSAEKPQRQSHGSAIEAAAITRTDTRVGANLAIRTGTEETRRVAEQATARFAARAQPQQAAFQETSQNLGLALQVANSAVSSYQAVWSEVVEHTQQAVQRTFKAFTQASQAPTPIALLNVQSRYLTDSLQAALVTHARLAEIAADMAGQTADKLKRRGT